MNLSHQARRRIVAGITVGGLLTADDLAAYRSQLREPLCVGHRGARVWTNPPPSVGGSIVADALSRLPDDLGGRDGRWSVVAEVLADATARRRGPGQVPTGTTHVSVVDADGGLAAITTSNGSGSGTVVPANGGALTFRLTVHGLATHASRRTEGVSAIEKFLPIMAALAALEQRRNRVVDPLMEELTAELQAQTAALNAEAERMRANTARMNREAELFRWKTAQMEDLVARAERGELTQEEAEAELLTISMLSDADGLED